MTILRTGSTEAYADNFERAFGKKSAAKKASPKKKASATKAKKKAAPAKAKKKSR